MAFFYLGGLALIVGAVAGFLIASSAVWRGWLLVGHGGLLMLLFFGYVWSQASQDGLACHDSAATGPRRGAPGVRPHARCRSTMGLERRELRARGQTPLNRDVSC
jgi:hypothetical protein